MARPHALVAALLLPAAAAAEPIDLPDTRATLELDTQAWTRVEKPGLVAAFARDGDALAITRAQVPNVLAWREKTRDAYVEQIERGVAASIEGYKRRAKKLTVIEGVPVLDLEATGNRNRAFTLRFILFRTYALALAIETSREDQRIAREIARGFVPPPPRPEGSP